MFTIRLRNALVRPVSAILVAAVAALAPAISAAGPCDLTWDGKALAQNAEANALATPIRLLDRNKNVVGELTGAQILAVSEAKVAIAKELRRSPSLIFCSDKAPNAFAANMPNGEVIAFTIGMAKLVDGDRDMAAIVIGHEYGHLVLGHLAAAQSRRSTLALLGDLAGLALEVETQMKFNVQGLGMNAGQMAASLVSYKFDRDQERQADEAGFRYMVDAGFNPLGAVRLAEKMQISGSGGAGLFMDNHPGWPERTDRFKRLIAASPEAQATIARTGTCTALTTLTGNARTAQAALVAVYEATSAERAFADGAASYGKQDFPDAVAAFRASAAKGYAPAQNALGYLYAGGMAGLPKDEVEAVRLYRLAVAQSNAAAMTNMGEMYLQGRGGLVIDGDAAARLFRLAIQQSNSMAMYYLGTMYWSGQGGVSVDYTQAARYFKPAADSGNSAAQVALGSMYLSGDHGFPRDRTEAVRLFRLSAGSGNAAGEYELGLAYEIGLGGLSRDTAIAIGWYRKAAAQNLEPAANKLRDLHAD